MRVRAACTVFLDVREPSEKDSGARSLCEKERESGGGGARENELKTFIDHPAVKKSVNFHRFTHNVFYTFFTRRPPSALYACVPRSVRCIHNIFSCIVWIKDRREFSNDCF